MSSKHTKHQPGRAQRPRVVRAAPGALEVLSVGRGHLKLTVTPGDTAELDKARTVIEDMLVRGASIFVELADGSTRRVKRFDPRKMVYYIDPPTRLAPPAAVTDTTPAPAKAHRRKLVGVPVAGVKATAVGRTAGG